MVFWEEVEVVWGALASFLVQVPSVNLDGIPRNLVDCSASHSCLFLVAQLSPGSCGHFSEEAILLSQGYLLLVLQ